MRTTATLAGRGEQFIDLNHSKWEINFQFRLLLLLLLFWIVVQQRWRYYSPVLSQKTFLSDEMIALG